MNNQFKTLSAALCLVVLVAGCATPQPVPFQLVDSASAVQKGKLFPDRQRMEVTIDGQQYKGFYLIAAGSAFSQSFGGWRAAPRQSVTNYTSNSARAQLTSEKGQHLSCEFLFEGNRAIGECQTPAGAKYQMSAGDE
jgi:hypothetical protein